MAFANGPEFEDDFRKVGDDATASFEKPGAPSNPTGNASSENLGVAPVADEDDDLEDDEDDDLEEDDEDDAEDDDDLEDDEDDVIVDEEDEEFEDEDDDDLDDEEDDEEELEDDDVKAAARHR